MSDIRNKQITFNSRERYLSDSLNTMGDRGRKNRGNTANTPVEVDPNPGDSEPLNIAQEFQKLNSRFSEMQVSFEDMLDKKIKGLETSLDGKLAAFRESINMTVNEKYSALQAETNDSHRAVQ